MSYLQKEVSRTDHLVSYFRINLGKKPCVECGKYFTDGSGRNRHIKTLYKKLNKQQHSELKSMIQKALCNLFKPDMLLIFFFMISYKVLHS